MTLRSLEIFTAVAQCGKMKQAADALHVTQPTVSQAVAELERKYGVLLFERLSKRLYITDAGRRLLVYAQSVLGMVGEMERDMTELSVRKMIRVGATQTVGRCVMVELVTRYEEQNPDATIQVTIDNTATIEELLLGSALDMGLVEGRIVSADLLVEPVMADELLLVCHPKHPLAVRGAIGPEELAAYSFILREEGSGTRETLLHELDKHSVRVTPKWSCHGFDTIVEAVLAGQGISVLSRRMAQSYIDSGLMAELDVKGLDMNRQFCIVTHKTKHISPAMRQFIDSISK